MHMSLCGPTFSFLSSRYEEVEFPGMCGKCMFNILWNCQVVSKMHITLFVPPNKERVNTIGLDCSKPAHSQERSGVKTGPSLGSWK